MIKKVVIIIYSVQILIALSCSESTGPKEKDNHLPEIIGLTSSQTPVQPGDTLTITCNAIDTDNDTLYYEWIVENGKRPSPFGFLRCGRFVTTFNYDSSYSLDNTIDLVAHPVRTNGDTLTVMCRVFDGDSTGSIVARTIKIHIDFPTYEGPHPQWIYDSITYLEGYKSINPLFHVDLYQSDYGDGLIYTFLFGCRDGWYPIYDADGNVICHSGGRDGQGDGKCDFSQVRNDTLIWKSYTAGGE